MRFRSAQHVRTTREFERVRGNGKRRDCGAFLLHLLEVDDEERAPVRRLGVVASRRVGKSVQRARAKRLLRETFRLNQDALPTNCDVVLTARASILGFDFETLGRRFRGAVHQARTDSSAGEVKVDGD